MNLLHHPDTAEGTAPPVTAPITTQSDEFEIAAASEPNKDLHVPVTDLLFDGQTVEVEVLKPELVRGEGKSLAIRHRFKTTKDELVSIDQPPVKKAPGHEIRPFPFELTADDGSQGQRQEISQRDLNKLLIAAKLVKKTDSLNKGQIIAMQGKLTGAKVLLRLTTRKGTKRDESGQFQVFQNIQFAAVGEQANGTAEAPGAAVANY